MLRTASSLPLTGLLTLGSDPARFQTEPPACYRASWQLPGPDLHRQATTSLRTARSAAKSQRHLPFCWAHGRSSDNLACVLIGDLAAQAGMSTKAIRFYEQTGLMRSAPSWPSAIPATPRAG